MKWRYHFVLLLGFSQVNAADTVTIRALNQIEVGSFLGEVQSENSSKISVMSEGQVVFIADAGAMVKAGEVIGRMENPSLNFQRNEVIHQIAEKKARLKFHQLMGQRYQKLLSQKSIPEETLLENALEIDVHQSQILKLENTLQEIDYRIEELEIKAPYSGIVINKMSDIGEWLTLGDPLIFLQRNDRFLLNVAIPMHYLEYIQGLGSQVSLIDQKTGSKLPEGVILPPTSGENFFQMNIEVNQYQFSGQKVDVTMRLSSPSLFAVPNHFIQKRAGKLFVEGADKHRYEVEVIRYGTQEAIVYSRNTPLTQVALSEDPRTGKQ
ncbi:efflux RND transporter periplasmic adaptor subunit [Algicola sagamiensis]|uniref:efflux RND transporter periplasmic adaptor subunit n=1 Tax=Algicola sagamiensis TaxID=163869 RepID=UPI000366E314|nr:HlyD family efflux transporter periplasmic adaptor subunit [Algicola sagamiensis]